MPETIMEKDVDILRREIARKRRENELARNIGTPEAQKKVSTNELIIGAYSRLIKPLPAESGIAAAKLMMEGER